MGYLTNKMPKDKKQKIVIAFDIAVILVFVWWAFNERTSYTQGYIDTLNLVCKKYIIDFCPNWEKMKNMTLDDISNWNRTGTELPTIIKSNLSDVKYCDIENTSRCI
jgi:hypothetical protein